MDRVAAPAFPTENASPSPERVLTQILLTAFPLRGEPRVVSAHTFPPSLFSELVTSAKENGLATILYAALAESNAALANGDAALADKDATEENVPLQELRELYLCNRMAARLAYDSLGALLDAFGQENIPILVLKGAAVSALLYPEPGLRAFGDLDLLIQRDDLAAAQAIMAGKGFEILLERHAGFSEQYQKSLNYISAQRSGLAVDLHWHLFAPLYYRRRIPMNHFWQNPLGLTIAERSAQTLAPQMQLLYLCAHAALHHPQLRLIWLYDIALLVERYQREMDWDEIVRTAQQLELAVPVAQVLARAVEWWDAPVPAAPLAALAQTRQRLPARIVYFLVSSPQNEMRVFADALYQKGWRHKFGYAAQLIFPSRAYMRSRHTNASQTLLPVWYLKRLVHILRLIMRSLWSNLTRLRF